MDSTDTRVEAAYMVERADVDWLALPSALTDHLLDIGCRQLCLTLVERDQHRYTLVLDPQWTEFASDVRTRNPDLIEGMELPRSVILAVIDLWPGEWVRHDPACHSIANDHDGVPHLSFGRVQN